MSAYELVGVDSKDALTLYEHMRETIKLDEVNIDLSREIELLGEAYPYAHFNEDMGFFDQVALINPDNITIRDNPLAYGDNLQIEYEPDELLYALVHSQDPRDREIVANLDPVIVWAVQNGSTIPIDPFNIRQVARKASPYDLRGTPILLRALKDLLYEDKLREAQYAIADSKIYPKEIWRLGDDQWIPSEEELNDFRKLLSDAAHDPVFSIVTHKGVNVTFEGAAGRLLPIVPEFEFVKDRTLIALHGSAAMFGDGGPYATANVAFAITQGRYQAKRMKVFGWNQYLFEQVALFHGFFRPTKAELDHNIRVKGKERELDIPKQAEWKTRLQLVEDPQRTSFYRIMRDKLEMSYRSWCEQVGIDPEREVKRIKEEEGTVVDPLYQQNRQLANKAAQEEVLREHMPQLTPDEAKAISDEVSPDTWELQTGVGEGAPAGGVKAPAQHKAPQPVTKVPGIPGKKSSLGGRDSPKG